MWYRHCKASHLAVWLGSEQDSSGNLAMWGWCYSFGSKLKNRQTGILATAMLFLPLFKRHCLPNIEYVLRSYAEYKRKTMTLTLGPCKGNMMPWKFQRSQMHSAGECAGSLQTGFVWHMMFWIRCQCLEIGSFYIEIRVSPFFSKSRNLITLGSNAMEAPVSGSPLDGPAFWGSRP